MDVTEFESVIGHLQSSRYAALASSCIIFFDFFLTLDEEVEYIWKAPWTPGKTLFVLNRYYTLASAIFNNYGLFSPNLTDNFCSRWIQWQGYTGLVSAMLSQMILQMRLFALFCMKRSVVVSVTIFFALASAASAAVMAHILSRVNVTSHIIPQYPFCVPSNISEHFYAFWIPILASETMLCFSALYRGYLSLQEDQAEQKRGVGDSFLMQSGRKLVAMLIYDSVLYFLATFATYAVNLIMFIAAPPTLIEIPIGFSVAIASVLSSRLILRVRHVRKEIEFVNHISYSVSHSPSPVTFSPPSITSSTFTHRPPVSRPSFASSTHFSLPPSPPPVMPLPPPPSDAFSPIPMRSKAAARRAIRYGSGTRTPPGLGIEDAERGECSRIEEESKEEGTSGSGRLGVAVDMVRTPTRESCIGIAL